jgi:uncharacterized protein (TIGR02246 family)
MLAVLVACQPATESVTEQPATAAPALGMADAQSSAESYKSAVESGDIEALVSMFTDDGMIMPSDLPAVAGKEAIRAYFTAMIERSAQVLNIKVEEAFGDGDIGYSRGVFSSATTPKPSGEPINIVGKWSSVSKRQSDGSWKIYRHIWNTDEPVPRPAS